MSEGLFIAASGGLKQLRKLDVISNNLANVSTGGFKKDILAFSALIPPFKSGRSLDQTGNEFLSAQKSNAGVSYVSIEQLRTDHSQGSLNETGNPFDLALDGDGFFKIKTPNGVRYTRKGNFSLDPLGQLITKDGHQVLGDTGGDLVVDATAKTVSIDTSGNLVAGTGFENTPFGKIGVVRFSNPNQLIKEGGGLFRKSGPGIKELPADSTIIRQGFTESSNVNSVEEMSDMIATHRLFEAYQKVIQAFDEMDGQSVNNIARVA